MTDNTTPLQSTDEPDNMLPPLQMPTDNQAVAGGAPSGPPPTDFGGTVPAGQTMPVNSALVPMPEAAADNDLIEKEWVMKAKEIVERTAEDPFVQQQEISKMKAAYMKKRYNKDLGAS